MRITHEEPGRRPEIEETEGRRAPTVFLLGLAALVATPWRGMWALWMHGTPLGTDDLVWGALCTAAGLFLALSTARGHRLERLSADRVSSRLEWRRSHVLGLVRWGAELRLQTLQGLALSIVSPPGRSTTTLRLAFQHGPGSRGRGVGGG